MATTAALGLVARWVTLSAILIAIGTIVFRFVVVPRAHLSVGAVAESSRTAARLGVIAAICILPAALVRLGVQTAQMRFPDDPWLGLAIRLLTSTSWGAIWMIQVGAAVVLVALFTAWRATAAQWVSVVFTVLLSLTPTLASHAMSADSLEPVAIAADVVHVLAAGGWIGTLAVLFAALRGRDANRDVLRRWLAAFSPVALTSAGAVVLSGSISSLLRVRTVGALLTTTYGQTLLVKLAVVAMVFVLGWFNWKRNTPAVVASGASPIRAGMRTELIAAAIVLIVTALLITTSPPMESMPMP